MGRKAKDAGAQPTRLLDRILASGATRVALLGLHPGAGSRTVLASLVRDLQRKQLPFAVTSCPREPEDVEAPEPVTRIALPEGAWIAGAAPSTAEQAAGLELAESTGHRGSRGEIGIYRVVDGGEFELRGPEDIAAMGTVMERLAVLSGGVTLVDGNWTRRRFAAPGSADGIVLSVGAGYSASPERSAAAAGYAVETLRAPACPPAGRQAWEHAASHNAAALLGEGYSVRSTMPLALEDPLPSLRAVAGGVRGIALPQGVGDELLSPLVPSEVRCPIIVHDATRIDVAPVYFKAWQKTGGTFEVVHPVRILALTTNPVSYHGADAAPADFCHRVASSVPDLPVHDVVVESREASRRPVWRFWDQG